MTTTFTVGECQLTLVRRDEQRGAEGWAVVVVLSVDRGEAFSLDDDNEILRALDEAGIYRAQCEGSLGPGQPFASAPWVRVIGKTVLVEQQGGLDV